MKEPYYSRIIVTEQDGCYFALGENGGNFCTPDRDISVFAGILAKAAGSYVNGRMTRGSLKESSGLEVSFEDKSGKVFFFVEKDHGTGKINCYHHGEKPTQGKAKIFYNAFCNDKE